MTKGEGTERRDREKERRRREGNALIPNEAITASCPLTEDTAPAVAILVPVGLIP